MENEGNWNPDTLFYNYDQNNIVPDWNSIGDYIIKYNSNGEFGWLEELNWHNPKPIAADENNNLYAFMSGNIADSIYQATTHQVAARGLENFIVKFDTAMHPLLAEPSANTLGYSLSNMLVPDIYGHIYQVYSGYKNGSDYSKFSPVNYVAVKYNSSLQKKWTDTVIIQKNYPNYTFINPILPIDSGTFEIYGELDSVSFFTADTVIKPVSPSLFF